MNQKKEMERKIVVPVYYTELDNGETLIDEEGIREEFERQLKLKKNLRKLIIKQNHQRFSKI